MAAAAAGRAEAGGRAAAGARVLVRGRVHAVRAKGKGAFLVLRQRGATVQCVLFQSAAVSRGMVKYASGLTRESVVDVEGELVDPGQPIEATTQQVEIHVRKVFAVSRAVPALPLSIEDAARSELDFEQEGVQYVRVGQDTRLNHRYLDLRTPANQAIFRIQSAIGQLFRDYLARDGFVEIHTPKLIAGASEGGASVFTLDYKGRPACLAQSPQLYKQMAICADFGRVFEVGPVFRAEDSFTHRHLCEFTGLDMEMEILEHYFEVLDVLDKLFVGMFDALNERWQAELQAIARQYPFEPLKVQMILPLKAVLRSNATAREYLRETLRLTFAEGIELLKEAGVDADPLGDLSTETERQLGELVKAKYGTEFYILHRYPLAARPFYTMPCADDPRYTNSFDIFIRGEEIISGAQRIHEPQLLTKRAEECGIDVESIACGAPPHGGCGVGLERVAMLFCNLNNIRKTSMFPRDPQRLTP
eukprot:SM000200S05829  [mRNA]  locus=s200:229171:233555:+ [translate_table: standard]